MMSLSGLALGIRPAGGFALILTFWDIYMFWDQPGLCVETKEVIDIVFRKHGQKLDGW